MEEQDLLKAEFSGKLSMLVTIIRESETLGDKILVFRLVIEDIFNKWFD